VKIEVKKLKPASKKPRLCFEVNLFYLNLKIENILKKQWKSKNLKAGRLSKWM